jgi:2-iminobutanoate/2-iminopropanoate deaminase
VQRSALVQQSGAVHQGVIRCEDGRWAGAQKGHVAVRGTDVTIETRGPGLRPVSDAEREEMIALGILSAGGELLAPPAKPGSAPGRPVVPRRAITAHQVLNEAYAYPRPSSFARGIRIDPGQHSLLLISGTASVDEAGLTAHVGDFRAQLWRTYRNITALLATEGATWHDVVRTTCYLRDIERDYKDFNEVRTAFFSWVGLDPLPASTGIQARLCREDLLVEIEAMAVVVAAAPAGRA